MIALPDDAATDRAGAALAQCLRVGDVICLVGDLGAGKTALVRAAIRARLRSAGHPGEDIPSPTFTIVQTYDADVPIWHADLYRLSGADEVWELGLDEAFDTAITFIEWPDRLAALTPARRLVLTMRPSEDGGRTLTWTPFGPGWEAAIDSLRQGKKAGQTE